MNVPRRYLTGRMPVVWAMLAICLGLIAGYFVYGSSAQAWRLLHVPSTGEPLNVTFMDMRTITHSLDCLNQGVDPYTDTRCDPWDRVFNYPPIWLSLRHLGIDSRHTDLLGWLAAACLMGCFLHLFSPHSGLTGIITFLAMTSPPVVLGMARANIDLLVFSATIAGIYLSIFLKDRISIALRCVLVVALSILKLYPIAISALFLRRTPRSWFLAVAVAAVSVAAIIATAGDRLLIIAGNTPQTENASFGSTVVFLAISKVFYEPVAVKGAQFLLPIGYKILRPLASILAAVVFAGLFTRIFFSFSPSAPETMDQRDRLLDQVAIASLSVFCFCFIIGTNFNYRLIFIIAALPALLSRIDRSRRKADIVAACVFVLFLWLSGFTSRFNGIILLGGALQWLVFVYVSVWLSRLLAMQAIDYRKDDITTKLDRA